MKREGSVVADARDIACRDVLPRGPSLPVRRQLSTRRQLLIRTLATGATAAGGAALTSCVQPSSAASGALPPPETTTVRIVNPPACEPGIWLAKNFLLDEGFTDVSFVQTPFTSTEWIARGLADVALAHPEFAVATLDAGLPLLLLAGVHSGCLELWARQGIDTVADLRGKRIAVRVKDISDQFFAFFATLLGRIGFDPLKDVQFVEGATVAGMNALFLDGRADAVLAGAQFGPLLRRMQPKPGNVILATMDAQPWSHYFCCHIVANREWAHRNPIATKRVTRALLRATDAAAKDAPQAAREAAPMLGLEESIVVETMAMCTYNWRALEPEDTLLFFALWLGAAKLIKSTPRQLIALGADFRYMLQLRTELTL